MTLNQFSIQCCVVFIVLTTICSSSETSCPDNKTYALHKSHIYEHQQFDGNNIACWMANDGLMVSHRKTGWGGLEWPKGSGKTADYCSGLWIVGQDTNGELRSAVSQYASEFRPGIILLDGIPDDPDKPEYRIYKINKDGTGDWAEWPFHLGAPALKARDGSDSLDTNGDKIPRLLGDQTLWWVMNDANPEQHQNIFNTKPMGLEVHVTAFGFHDMGPLSNMLFYEFNIHNKSEMTFDSTYIGLFDDVDLGDASSDQVGCDPELNMGFAYNPPYDATYHTRPPAYAFQLLHGPNTGSIQAPQRLGMTSFTYFW